MVTAVPAVGTILALALIVAPAGAARLWTDRIAPMIVLSVGLSVACALGGLQLSRMFDVAAGGAVSLLAATVFTLSVLAAPGNGVAAHWVRRCRSRQAHGSHRTLTSGQSGGS